MKIFFFERQMKDIFFNVLKYHLKFYYKFHKNKYKGEHIYIIQNINGKCRTKTVVYAYG